MLRACPSSAFTWEPATQFLFVVVLGWFLHLKGSRKLESPMTELQPCWANNAPAKSASFWVSASMNPSLPLRVILEQPGLMVPASKEDSLVSFTDRAVKLLSGGLLRAYGLII